MGARWSRGSRAGFIGVLVALALICSAWLAFATTSPSGTAGSSGGNTTTTRFGTSTTTSTPRSTTSTTMPHSNLAKIHGAGFVGHCFFAPNAVFLKSGKSGCAEFQFAINRNAQGGVHGSLKVECDKSPTVIFKATAFSNVSVNGNSASFTATGTIDSGVPLKSPGTANVSVTDNDGNKDLFAFTLTSGTKTVCSAANAVTGDIEVLTGTQKDTDKD